MRPAVLNQNPAPGRPRPACSPAPAPSRRRWCDTSRSSPSPEHKQTETFRVPFPSHDKTKPATVGAHLDFPRKRFEIKREIQLGVFELAAACLSGIRADDRGGPLKQVETALQPQHLRRALEAKTRAMVGWREGGDRGREDVWWTKADWPAQGLSGRWRWWLNCSSADCLLHTWLSFGRWWTLPLLYCWSVDQWWSGRYPLDRI